MLYVAVSLFTFTTIILYMQNQKLLMELAKKDTEVYVLEDRVKELKETAEEVAGPLDLSKLTDTF